ncbi:MAG: EamA family transporter [Pirellulaceae bacterium]|nr:EamA family transporter [Pirellulaceae bacterium]
MIYLLLNILFGSAFMLFIKWAHVRQREDVVTIGAINYIVAVLLIAPLLWNTPRECWTTPSMLTGAANGLSYFAAYFFVIYAIRWVGASSTTVISVLSILVPIAFGVFYWGEHPSLVQAVGIFLALGALTMIGGQKKSSRSSVAKPGIATFVLVIFFLLCGISRLAQESFKYLDGTAEEIMPYNFSLFLTAGIPSAVVLMARGKAISRSELAFGFAMGLTNFLQTLFILEALQDYQGFIVFPVVSGGAIILTTFIATQFLGEHLQPKSYVGIAIAAISLILLQDVW